jgi:hypothetical protein
MINKFNEVNLVHFVAALHFQGVLPRRIGALVDSAESALAQLLVDQPSLDFDPRIELNDLLRHFEEFSWSR